MKQPDIPPNLIVADLLARWPETIPVFMKYRMSCVGCAMAPFETLVDATAIYKVSLQRFVHDLTQAIYSGGNS